VRGIGDITRVVRFSGKEMVLFEAVESAPR
jgi:hypothetical protein